MELKELMRELVTDEQIEYAIRQIVDEKFNYYLNREIEEKVSRMIGDKADSYIVEEIDKVMANKVRIDDGWGNVTEYGSFDDYVRHSISKKMKDSWNVERKVREAVETKLKTYVAKAITDIEAERVDDVLINLATDILKEADNDRS